MQKRPSLLGEWKINNSCDKVPKSIIVFLSKDLPQSFYYHWCVYELTNPPTNGLQRLVTSYKKKTRRSNEIKLLPRNIVSSLDIQLWSFSLARPEKVSNEYLSQESKMELIKWTLAKMTQIWNLFFQSAMNLRENSKRYNLIDYSTGCCRSITAKPTYIKKEKDIPRLPEI